MDQPIELGFVKFEFMVAVTVRLTLPSDVMVPETKPAFEVFLVTRRFGKDCPEKKGRHGTRKVYYQPEHDDLYKHPRGRKPIDLPLQNKQQVLDFIHESIKNLSG